MSRKSDSTTADTDTSPQQELEAQLEVLIARLRRQFAEVVKAQNELLLEELAQEQLLSVKDVAETLAVSKRTVETIIADGKLTPLWIRGQRRFHPAAVDAYIRSCERKRCS